MGLLKTNVINTQGVEGFVHDKDGKLVGIKFIGGGVYTTTFITFPATDGL